VPQVGGASACAPVAQPRRVKQDAPPGAGGLHGRVTSDHNPGPRAGLLSSLGAIFQSVVRFFSRGAPEGSRLHTQQQPLPREGSLAEHFERQLEQRIAYIDTMLTTRGATPAGIAAALDNAVAAAAELRRAGGSPMAALENYRLSRKDQTDQSLMQLARAFQGPTVGAAQRLNQNEGNSHLSDGAQHLLMNMEQAVLKELNDRLPNDGVKAALEAAVGSLHAGESSARIGDQIHAAFDSALPLVKAGVRRAAPTQDDVDQAVRLRLLRLPEKDLVGLLPHIHSEDLARLKKLWTPKPEEPARALFAVEARIEAEIAARTPRLADTFREHARKLCDRYDWNASPRAQVDHKALQNDLVALAASLEELEAHCRLHGIASPLTGQERVYWREALAGLTARSFEPPHGSPQNLSSRELVRLSSAVHALGLPVLGDHLKSVFRPAQKSCLARQRELFRTRFSEFVSCAKNTGTGAAETRPLLRALAELEQASRELQDAHIAFDWEDPAHRPSSSKASGPALSRAAAARQAQAELIRECLAEIPTEATVLGARLGSKLHQGLIAALHVGADLASGVRERQLAERFANMAHVHEQVATAAGATPSGASSPAENRKFAADNLPAAARRMLREDYGLAVPVEGPPTLQAGRLTATQTHFMAQLFEQPPSVAQSKLVEQGPYLMNQLFHKDAMRGFPLHIDMPRPASQQEPVVPASPHHLRPLARSAAAAPLQPPAAEASPSDGPEHELKARKEARAAAVENTFRDLVSLCRGDENLANTVALYANQEVMAAFDLTCNQADPPVFHLQDGTPGTQLAITNVKDPRQGPKKNTQVTIRMGENGQPQLEADCRVEGRAIFVGVDGSQTFLSPDSHLQVHIHAEIDAEGRLRLLEAPSYQFDLRPDDFQKPYRPPTIGDVLAANDGDEMLVDLRTYSQGTGAWPYVAALRALAQFKREPTLENAAAVVTACDMPPGTTPGLLSEGLRSTLYGAEPGVRLSPAFFGHFEQRLNSVLEAKVLPGMINAVRHNRV
jgi:hypothetical protein